MHFKFPLKKRERKDTFLEALMDANHQKKLKGVRGRVQTTWTNEGGGGVAQMTTTLNNSYLVKMST